VVANLKQIEPAENKDETHRGKKTQIYNKRLEKCRKPPPPTTTLATTMIQKKQQLRRVNHYFYG
jgi:hypothetical protein